MKKIITTAGMVALTATAASAGGLDRSGISYGTLFEKGQYFEGGVALVRPDTSGIYAPVFGGGSTGNITNSYTTYSLAYKNDINKKISFGVFATTPYGASVLNTQGAFSGLSAEVTSQQITALVKYNVARGLSVYGGMRVTEAKASIAVPDTLIRGAIGAGAQAAAAGAAAAQTAAAAAAAAGNAAAAAALAAQATALGAQAAAAGALAQNTNIDLQYDAVFEGEVEAGVVVGIAYERPEIALRVSLTYEGGLDYDFDTTENVFNTTTGTRTVVQSTTSVELPDAIVLDFQTGVAKNTLVFGSVRYAEWSVFTVSPVGFTALLGTPLTDFDNDVVTYTIGVGQRINDSVSVFARLGYEKENDNVASPLAPTDGYTSVGVGAAITHENAKVTMGVEYIDTGDAVDSFGTQYADNDGLGFGLKFGYTF